MRAAASSHKPRPFAGWSGRKRIFAALIGLLFLGGLGLGFGILIHLKKNGKTTNIEVPEGSTAHVDAQRAVTVELPSSPAPAATTPRSAGEGKPSGESRPASATRAPTTKQAVMALVEDFFRHNFRDVTSRETIEWGKVTKLANGNASIRYKYRAKIWDRDTVINNQVFTFDKQGEFVSVVDVNELPPKRMSEVRTYEVHKTVADLSDREDLSTPETSYASIERAWVREGEAMWARMSVSEIAKQLPSSAKRALPKDVADHDFPFPYARIARGPRRWYTLELPATEVPEHFFVALAFNPEQTKGIYLGLDQGTAQQGPQHSERLAVN